MSNSRSSKTSSSSSSDWEEAGFGLKTRKKLRTETANEGPANGGKKKKTSEEIHQETETGKPVPVKTLKSSKNPASEKQKAEARRSTHIKLVNACEEVYKAYSAMNIAKGEKLFRIIGEAEYVTLEKMINTVFPEKSDSEINIEVKGSEIKYKLHIDPDPDKSTYRVKLTPVGQLPKSDSHPTVITQYKDQDKINLLCAQDFVLHQGENKKSEKHGLGIKLKSKGLIIGGPGKLDIYPEHLHTLYKIAEHLNRGGKMESILIALATGSGKTFVQAIWFLVLNIAEVNGIFSLPNNLIRQYIEDFKRLLPSNLVDKMSCIELNTEEDEACEQLAAMQGDAPAYVVASSERILDDPTLFNILLDAENISQSFDEQHLSVVQERRKVRLFELAENNLALFLTATPNRETYNMSGQKPVATMSSKQKQEAGHGKLGTVQITREQTIGDQAAELSEDSEDISISDKFWLSMVDVLQKQDSSPILTLLEQLQSEDPRKYYNKTKPVPPTRNFDNTFHQKRHAFQPLTAQKALILTDSNEEVINVDRFLHGTDSYGDSKINILFDKPPLNKRDRTPDTFYIYEHIHKDLKKEWTIFFQGNLCHEHMHVTLDELMGSFTDKTSKQYNSFKLIFENIIKGKILSSSQKGYLTEILDNYFCYTYQNEDSTQLPYEKRRCARKFPAYTNGNAISRATAYQFLLQEDNDVENK